jgi:tight adherence protein C
MFINKPFSKMPYLKGLQEKLDFLRLPIGAIELLFVKELLMFIAGAGVFYTMGASQYVLIAALVGFLLPDFMLLAKYRTRKEEIVRYFPDTVDLLDLCIGAGLDFLSSIAWIVDKSRPNPFMEELKVVFNDIRVGKPRVQALKDMAKRLNIPDISSFVRTIVQSERMGVSIEEALKNLSEDTRELRFQNGERQAIKASIKILVPLLFFILPVIMVVVAGPIIIKFTQGGLTPGGSMSLGGM